MKLFAKCTMLLFCMVLVFTLPVSARNVADSDTTVSIEANAADDPFTPISTSIDSELYTIPGPTSGNCGDHATWTISEDGLLTISGYGDLYPSSRGYSWYTFSNEERSFDRNLVKNVQIAEGITSLGDRFFADCSEIREITLPESLQSIGTYVFQGCSSLEHFEIPEFMTTIPASTFGGCSSLTEITIPEWVTRIEDFAFSSSGLIRVEIPDSVTKLGTSCFNGCHSLISIKLPRGLTEISEALFSHCDKLTDVQIPDGVKRIRTFAFFNCSELQEITIPSQVTRIDKDAFSYCHSLKEIILPDSVTTLGVNAFQYCTGATRIKLSSSLTTVSDRAFRHCENLTDLIIPYGVEILSGDAFSSCFSLAEVNLPESITQVGGYSFAKCRSLTEVTIPGSVKLIGNNAFEGCRKLTTVRIPDSVEKMYTSTFNDTALQKIECLYSSYENFVHLKAQLHLDLPEFKSYHIIVNGKEITQISIPSGVTAVEPYVFSGCSSLKRISIPSTVARLDPGAFEFCSGLTGLTIPSSVTEVGDRAFAGCSGLVGITLPESVTAIGKEAFEYCSGLREFTVPSRVTVLEEHAFRNCYNLQNVMLPDGLQTIAAGAFYGCHGFDHLVIPPNVTFIGAEAFYQCGVLNSLTVSDSLTEVQHNAFAGCIVKDLYLNYRNYEAFRQAKTALNPEIGTSVVYHLMSGGKEMTRFVIPDEVTRIDGGLFAQCTLTEAVIPESVTAIERRAFANSGIAQITMPDSVTFMGEYAFYGCEDLQNVVLSANLSAIPQYAFCGCTSLGSIAFPEGVTSIGSASFLECSSLKTAAIPTSVTTISRDAFAYTGLETVYYYGSPETWSTIQIASSNSPLLKAKIQYLPYIKITRQPQDVTVNEGETVTFSLKASGSGLKYQWYYKFPKDSRFTLWSGRTASAFNYTLNTSRNGMQLYCEVKDSTGLKVTSDIITVTVNELKPEIIRQPESVIVNDGEMTTFSVVAEGKDLKYQWYYKLAGSDHFTLWSGRTAPSFDYILTAAKNGMELYCEVKNSSGRSVKTDVITVMVQASRPVILQQPMDQEIQDGGIANFSVKASGNGLTYQWYYKLPAVSSFTKWTGRTSSSFNFTGVSSKSGMQVYCEVRDSQGQTVRSNTVTLTIRASLAITRQPADASTPVGGSVRIAVEATGEGLTYQWYFKLPGRSSFELWSGRTYPAFNYALTEVKSGMQVYCVVTDRNGQSVTSKTAVMTVV